MTTDQTRSDLAHNIFMLVVGIFLIGFGIAYGFASYRTDNCMQSVQNRLDSAKTRIEAARHITDPR